MPLELLQHHRALATDTVGPTFGYNTAQTSGLNGWHVLSRRPRPETIGHISRCGKRKSYCRGRGKTRFCMAEQGMNGAWKSTATSSIPTPRGLIESKRKMTHW